MSSAGDGRVGVDGVDCVVCGGSVGHGGEAVACRVVIPALGSGERAVVAARDLAGVVVAVVFLVAIPSDGFAATVRGEREVAGAVESAVGDAGQATCGVVTPRGGEEAVLDNGRGDLVPGVVAVSGHGRWCVGGNTRKQITRVPNVVNLASIRAGVLFEVSVVAGGVVFIDEGTGGSSNEGLGFGSQTSGFVVEAGDHGTAIRCLGQTSETVVFHEAGNIAVTGQTLLYADYFTSRISSD